MKIAVMGAGAVGCYYGGLLARAGHAVTLIGRQALVDGVAAGGGLLLDTQSFRERVPVATSTSASAAQRAQLVLFCVKSQDSAAAAAALREHLDDGAIVLSLQNGVDNAQRLRGWLRQPVLAAVVYVAVEMAGAAQVQHHGRGELVIEDGPHSAALAALLSAAGVPVQLSADVRAALWSKLAVNCAWNALSALHDEPYGQLVQRPGITDRLRGLMQECVAVAAAEGVALPDSLWHSVLGIAQTMPTQRSSMAQDLARGRRTEVEHINGHVVQRGRAHGIATPLNAELYEQMLQLQARGARRRVLVLGATGTIGQAAVRALLRQGHEVVCLVRERAGVGGSLSVADIARRLPGATLRVGDVRDPASLVRDGFIGERFDVLLSCLASRTGAPHDAWAIDHQAHLHALAAARQAGVTQMVLLSAICVQKPLLAFQQAKLAFEQALIDSGLNYSIVRPTAFFKSLSGQLDRLRQGKPFLVFGDGTLTACKPISDDDLGDYLARCVNDASLHRRVLPIGGPGPALTPRQQGEQLFALLGRPPRFKQVPVGLLDAIIGVLSTLGRVFPPLAEKAELARIGRYYATESMLVWDAQAGRYDAEGTPSTGSQTLFDFYAQLVSGQARVERGDHAVF